MKTLRAILLGLFVVTAVVGCGPRNPDTDPKADELDLKIDEGEGTKDSKK